MTQGGGPSTVSTVLVLNAGYERLQFVSLRHAIHMLFREVAEVEEVAEGGPIGRFQRPAVIRLKRYIQMRWRSRGGPSWSRRGLLSRDGHRCAFCAGRAETVDHLLPRSRGGTDSWLNTVAACWRCNNRKRNRTPEEAGMRLLFQPRVPHWSDVVAR